MCRAIWIDDVPYETEAAVARRIGKPCILMAGYSPMPPGRDCCLCGVDLRATVAQAGMVAEQCRGDGDGPPGDWIAFVPERR